jgi:hypothetical protein
MTGRDKNRGRHTRALEQRQRGLAGIPIAVVKCDDDGAHRQGSTDESGNSVRQAHRLRTSREDLHLSGEPLRRHGEPEWIAGCADTMISKHYDATKEAAARLAKRTLR